MTQDEIATRVGRRRTTIANSLRLLKLEPDVLAAISDGRLAEGTARALIGLEPERQRSLLKTILAGGLTTREVEDLVRKSPSVGRPRGQRQAPAMTAYFSGARQEIEEIIDLPVSISFRGNSGKVLISFNNLAQFKRLREQLSTLGSGDGEDKEPSAQKSR